MTLTLGSSLPIENFTKQAAQIETALSLQEKGQLENTFSIYAARYYDLLGALPKIKGDIQLRQALNERLQSLSARVEKAFEQVAASELQAALESNQVAAVRNILKVKNLLNQPLPNGEMPLHFAIRKNSEETVHCLLKEFSPDLFLQDHQQLSALNHAFLSGNEKIAILMLGNILGKQDIFDLNSLKQSLKTSGRDYQSLSELQKKFAFFPAKLLLPPHQASYLGDVKKIEEILARAPGLIEMPIGAENLTPIHLAALSGRDHLLQLFSQKGISLNIPSASGMTPLHFAILGKNKSTIAFLLNQQGSDPNLADAQGFTPLHYATALGDIELIKILVAKGADLSIASSRSTPLTLLFIRCQAEAMIKDPLKINWLSPLFHISRIGLSYFANTSGLVWPDRVLHAADMLPCVAAPAVPIPYLDNQLIRYALYNMPSFPLSRIFPLFQISMHLEQTLAHCMTAGQQIGICWKNRHLEVVRPILKGALHMVTAIGAFGALSRSIFRNLPVDWLCQGLSNEDCIAELDPKNIWHAEKALDLKLNVFTTRKTVNEAFDRMTQEMQNIKNPVKLARHMRKLSEAKALFESLLPVDPYEICRDLSIEECISHPEIDPKIPTHAARILGIPEGMNQLTEKQISSFHKDLSNALEDKNLDELQLARIMVRLNEAQKTLFSFIGSINDQSTKEVLDPYEICREISPNEIRSSIQDCFQKRGTLIEEKLPQYGACIDTLSRVGKCIGKNKIDPEQIEHARFVFGLKPRETLIPSNIKPTHKSLSSIFHPDKKNNPVLENIGQDIGDMAYKNLGIAYKTLKGVIQRS